MAVGTPGRCGQCTGPGIVRVREEQVYHAQGGGIMFGISVAVIAGGGIGCPVGLDCTVPEGTIARIGGMFQGIGDDGCIDTRQAGLVAGRTVDSTGVGQGISGIFLEIFDGMNGILA